MSACINIYLRSKIHERASAKSKPAMTCCATCRSALRSSPRQRFHEHRWLCIDGSGIDSCSGSDTSDGRKCPGNNGHRYFWVLVMITNASTQLLPLGRCHTVNNMRQHPGWNGVITAVDIHLLNLFSRRTRLVKHLCDDSRIRFWHQLCKKCTLP